MKVVIASDSFKGSTTSIGAASLIEAGARKVFPDGEYIKIPVADGGEGTVMALVDGRQTISVSVQDPLGRPIDAFYGIVNGKAILEMAAASGLPLLAEKERNPMTASTFGTGQIILAALKAGYTDITIGIGGSATNDGGAGMAQALGYRFLDADGNTLAPGGAALKHLAKIDSTGINPLLEKAVINVACDVDNPLTGEQGASAVYGPQKGASPDMAAELDTALAVLADVVEAWQGRDIRNLPGTGAAGGLGFGLIAFCNANLKSGIETILDLVDFDNKLIDADIVVTGEGKIDGQSIRGKVPIGVAARARDKGIPVLAIVGGMGQNAAAVYRYGIDSIIPSVDRVMPLAEAISRSDECIMGAAERAFRIIRIGMKLNEQGK